MNLHKKYILVFFIISAILAAPFFLLFIFLFRTGEVQSVKHIAKVQQQAAQKGNVILYGTGLHDNEVGYKLENYKLVKPKITVLGTSRVLQIRGSSFTQSFYNMGRCMGGSKSGRFIIDEMCKEHKPEVLIIGTDYWWFYVERESSLIEHEIRIDSLNSHQITLKKLISPVLWLKDKKTSINSFSRILASGTQHYGIQSFQFKDGYGPDGSWYYTGIVTGKKKDERIKLSVGMKYLENSSGRFRYKNIDDKKIDALIKLVKYIEEAGIKVYVISTPIPKSFCLHPNGKKMATQMQQIHRKLIKNNINSLEAFDPERFGGDDSEFVDWLHGGEITYLRILLKLCQRYKEINQYISIDYIKNQIKKNTGRAFIPNNKITNDPEVDFLELGIQK